MPIPGTRSISWWDENLGAANGTFTDDELRHLDEQTSRIAFGGARYPEHLERQTGL